MVARNWSVVDYYVEMTIYGHTWGSQIYLQYAIWTGISWRRFLQKIYSTYIGSKEARCILQQLNKLLDKRSISEGAA